MKEIIEAGRGASQAALKWADRFMKGEQRGALRDTILEGRAQLERVASGQAARPAAAVFGESQVGKSYLVQNLLKDADGVLNVLTDHNGTTANFILDLNPSGGGVESTSLITRFTAQRQDTGSEQYPIAVHLFSPVDVALTLTDSYFSDVQDHVFPSRDEIEARIAALEEEYGTKGEVQTQLQPVHLYEMADYIRHNAFPLVVGFIRDLSATRYLERVAAIIAAMPSQAWPRALGLLWNDNDVVGGVFTRLIQLLERLSFPTRVGIDVAPLLKVDGTILCVDRIKEFFGVTENEKGERVERARIPEMKVWTGTEVVTVAKSEFTSIAAEVVLSVPEQVARDKAFFAQLDILDMPGARSRQNIPEKLISQSEACTMLLRGRVSYLFNKYSRRYLISMLLFCHHEQKSEVMSLAGLLRSWIEDSVGRTPQERAIFLEGGKVPPLFLISTKFNIDLKRDPTKEPADAVEDLLENEARHRWVRRYTNSLANVIGENADNQWFSQWTPGAPFSNIYLLRDYAYSSDIYPGYLETGRESAPDAAGAAFLNRLRRSFLEHDFVQMHFREAEVAWERAATPNEDGADYIIENMVAAIPGMLKARQEAFRRIADDVIGNLYTALRREYHDDNADTKMQQALESAGRADLALDTLFSTRPQLFAQLLEAMLVREEKLHDRILEVSTDMNLLKQTDLNALFAIRDRAHIDPSLTREQNVQRLLEAYHLNSEQEVSKYLESVGFTIDNVINPPRTQNLPQILVETLEKYWTEEYINAGNLARFAPQGLPTVVLEDIAANLRALYFERLHLSDKIIERIRPYVTSPDRLGEMAEMLSDMVAEMLNRFVNTFGTAYFPAKLWGDIRGSVERNEANVELTERDYTSATLDEAGMHQSMATVFDVFENIDTIVNSVPLDREKLAYFSNYHAYRQWTEDMKAGFIAVCDIPTYDIAMNNALGELLETELQQNVTLKPLIGA